MKQQIPLVVVAGPTASGKTDMAIHLAKIFGGEKERLYLCTRFSGITDTHCERGGEERAKDL